MTEILDWLQFVLSPQVINGLSIGVAVILAAFVYASRLLRAMLPERPAPDGYRLEWARLAAAVDRHPPLRTPKRAV